MRAHEPERALAWYNEALLLSPRHPGLLHGKGLARAALGDRGLALAAFRRAVKIDGDAWRCWQSIADLTPDEAERLCAICAATKALRRGCARPDAGPDRFTSASKEMINAHLFDEAVRFAEQNFERFAHPREAHNRLASAYYHGGAFREAFFHKARALQLLHPFDPPDAAPAPAFDPAEAAAALKEVYDIFDAAGLKPFLTAGTLLGFVREGRPLAHDRDIDIGVIAPMCGAPNIGDLIREHPSLMLMRFARPGDRYFGLLHKGVGVDIFLHEGSHGHLLCGLSRHAGDIQWRFPAFEPAERDFGGVRFRTPETPERILEATYGPGWRRPDKSFASAIGSPALFEVDPYARAFYSAARAERQFLIGNREKALALIAQSPIPIDLPAPQSPDASSAPTPAKAIDPNE